MSNNRKKVFFTTIMCFTIMLPMVANAASYTGLSYSLKRHVAGAKRSYSKGNINVTAYNCTTQNNGNNPSSNKFTISLYKDGLWSDTCIGSAQYKRDSWEPQTNSWTNMAAGKYYISISKSTDNCRIEGNIDITQ